MRQAKLSWYAPASVLHHHRVVQLCTLSTHVSEHEHMARHAQDEIMSPVILADLSKTLERLQDLKKRMVVRESKKVDYGA